MGLAHYGVERHPSLELFKEHPRQKLLKLVLRRTELKQMLVQEKNRLKAPDLGDLKNSFKVIIEALEKQLLFIGEQIKEICSADIELKKQMSVLKTISGIADISAFALLALLPELGTVNRKQIASLAGVAPHHNESGNKVGYRFTRGGRSEVKPVLFMAAMAAARSHSELGEFYRKLIAAGKKKMVALVALMRKIVVIANARVRDSLAEKCN